MDTIIVRKANIEDLDSLVVLFDQLTDSDYPYDTEILVEWAHTENGKKYFLDKINQTHGVCFVAVLNDKNVGYATCDEKEVPSFRKVKVAALENLITDETIRGKGIGKKLMDSFKAWAKEIHAQKIAVNVFSGNKRGIDFYTREGFLPYESTLEMHVE